MFVVNTLLVLLWLALMVLCIAGLVQRTRTRRTRLDRPEKRCQTCGYDLRYTPGRCPECGDYVEQRADPDDLERKRQEYLNRDLHQG